MPRQYIAAFSWASCEAFGSNVAYNRRMAIVDGIQRRFRSAKQQKEMLDIYERYKNFTMIPVGAYFANLRVVQDYRNVAGCVVECGVWKGGMSAGMAHLLGPDRQYFLFDSFEGLPPANAELDGAAAVAYQADPSGKDYHDNCTAPQEDADAAMRLSGAPRYTLVKGWFENTLPSYRFPEPIAILRLDGDWYESIMTCLQTLVPHLAPGAVVILDDYGTWDGCSRAVHDYLSQTKSTARIRSPHDVAVIDGLGPTSR